MFYDAACHSGRCLSNTVGASAGFLDTCDVPAPYLEGWVVYPKTYEVITFQ